MHRWIGIAGCGVLALVLCQAPALPQEQKQSDVTLKVVKYDELCDVITKHRGKVIVVDFFTDLCIPCKKAFPHIVEMSGKYADKGLVTISVSLDPWGPEGFQKEMAADVLSYLKRQNARMTNLMLNEKGDFIQERLRIKTVPFIYVFDRQGRWTAFDGDRLGKHKQEFKDGKTHYFKYTEVEGLVQKLLEK